ncbi:MAG: hypothetical protein A2W90_08795 [Bacteroidetes bacterium GWF2_42_66]|nr:MAG: hypothetical protein A2W92_17530 [Bacteroidetes bacterium GWA2_42_15]OFX96766.1 MAG: hypothetical protein A2W89_21380 [Bacteroidetes bacterium GWE2_42_39]OFY45458.1 MAG: hypothetical protein A2W90_08795 [Bacteroidetes bacterium GWF2_42_66]HBL76157.1 hypothetical protein [Prolixibacteraceae bacterium]HCR91566.1 hypothetical protein [Prolixibacteraceae bacterium]
MKRLLFFIILIGFSVAAIAQVKVIKGKITDNESDEGIAYTNIGIEGTLYGTASNTDGFFELKIPEEHEQGSIYFSAVGYANRVIPVGELIGQEFVTIALEEQTYDIGNIDVAAQSKVLFRIIRTASERIKDNYLSGPYGLKIYYSEMKDGKKREAVVQMSDQNGYRSPSALDAFRSRNYRFTEAKRDFDVYSFPQGTTGFDELLQADLARVGNTILNADLINDYDLQLEKSTVFNGDSVWVIDYKTSKTDLAHTGSFGCRKFNGKIYISKTDYGIVRNELEIESGRQNPQGRSLAVKTNGISDVTENITVGYKKAGGNYVLAFVDAKKQFINADHQKSAIAQTLTVIDVQTSNVLVISDRDYFESTAFNVAFWEKFIRPQ